MFSKFGGVLLAALACWLSVNANAAVACLSTSADTKAVQWSTQIVQAKLISISAPIALHDPSTRPSASADQAITYVFKVTDVYDGSAKPDDSLNIVRFTHSTGEDHSDCGQALGAEQIGKSFVLLLRPQADLVWSRAASDPDPRPGKIADKQLLAVVYLATAEDVGADGLSYLKTTIAETRDAESKFSAEDAKLQASTLATAADDTEAEQAEHTLAEMGPKALQVIREVSDKSNDVGKARLAKVVDAISPPALNAAAATPASKSATAAEKP